MITAFVFNLCMLILPLAGAASLLVVARDHLYAYEYSAAGAHAISARVERLNADLIQLDFDRLNQWDDLIAMELMAGDIPAARGFLLSGGAMLPPRYGNAIRRAEGQNDAAAENAALEILTPGTRARYESMVPLLSRRASSVQADERQPGVTTPLGDQQDFELLARAAIADPNTDTLQFVLTGLGLGLGGDFSEEAASGAMALLAASRRPDFPSGLSEELDRLLSEVLSADVFRTAALADADLEHAGDFANAAAAFRTSVNPAAVAQLDQALETIGAMAAAISVPAASNLITHATALRDLPRLRLVAQAAGDRAAAAAKRAPRDGRLLAAARGDLTITRELAMYLTIAALAFLGLIGIVGFKAYQSGRRLIERLRDDEYGGELVDIGANNWRPL